MFLSRERNETRVMDTEKKNLSVKRKKEKKQEMFLGEKYGL